MLEAELAQQFEGAPSHDEAVQEATECAVSERWSEGDRALTDVLPLTEELSGSAPALVDERPALPFVHYLQDDAGRIVLARAWRYSDELVAGASDEVVRYAGQDCWLLRYEHDGAEWQLDRVRRQRFDGSGQLLSEETYARYGGYYWTAFRYQDGVVVQRERGSSGDEPIIETVERNSEGVVVRLQHGNDVTWERPRASSDVVARLADALAPSIDALRSGRPWLIWLRYTGDGPYWTDAAWPKLSAASQDDRTRLGSAFHWRDAWDWTCWSVPEVAQAPPDDVVRVVDGQNGEADLEQVGSLMQRVAARLSATRPDVLLVAVDQELMGMDTMLAHLPVEARAALAAAHMDPSAQD